MSACEGREWGGGQVSSRHITRRSLLDQAPGALTSDHQVGRVVGVGLGQLRVDLDSLSDRRIGSAGCSWREREREREPQPGAGWRTLAEPVATAYSPPLGKSL